jgi:hypothetical protein
MVDATVILTAGWAIRREAPVTPNPIVEVGGRPVRRPSCPTVSR